MYVDGGGGQQVKGVGGLSWINMNKEVKYVNRVRYSIKYDAGGYGYFGKWDSCQ